ncbi:MAG: helix-turn-helix domain-containing protein [Kineosporiaceae bacterium]|nr:helix-turn-helix domain-containing protein [Aeromicrobium sp.]
MPIVDDMDQLSMLPDGMSPLLGSSQVAELLGMSREQVWRLWTSGRLPGYRFDRYIRFSRVDLEQFMSRHYTPSASLSAARSHSQHHDVGEAYRRI